MTSVNVYPGCHLTSPHIICMLTIILNCHYVVAHLLKMCVAAAQHANHMHALAAFTVNVSDQLDPTCQQKRYRASIAFTVRTHFGTIVELAAGKMREYPLDGEMYGHVIVQRGHL